MRKADCVWVRNNGDEIFSSRYDGEAIELAPGKAEEFTLAAAELLFGMGEDDKSRCLRRLGWMNASQQMDQALARLNKFSFHMDNPKYEQKQGKNPEFAPGIEGEGGETGQPATPPKAGVLGKLSLHRAAPAA